MDVIRIDPLVSQIQSRFGWKISGQWNNAALTAILQAGDQIASYVHSLNQRDGDAIVRRYFPAQFIHSDWLGSLWFLKGKSFVFPRRVVRLAPNFEIYQHPDWHVVHELGHVLDNAVRRFFPATFLGGGLADRMIRDTGGRPHRCGLRFVPRADYIERCNLMEHWEPIKSYGNTCVAEDFAETFVWTLFSSYRVPPRRLDWMRAFLKSLE